MELLCSITTFIYYIKNLVGELRYLRRYEEHGRAVLTSCYASATVICDAIIIST